IGVAASDGKLLWHYSDIRDPRGNVHTAIIKGNEVFASCGWGVGAALLKIVPDGAGLKVEPLYRVKISAALEAWRGSSVLLGNFVITTIGGSIEWKTGRVAEFDRRLGVGTITLADGRLYHRSSKNKLTLWEVTEKGVFVPHGEFTIPHPGTEPPWTFPVIAG